HVARGLVEDAGEDLEQRALARAVGPDDTDNLSAANVKRNIAQGPALLVTVLAEQDFLDQMPRAGIKIEALGQAAHFEDGRTAAAGIGKEGIRLRRRVHESPLRDVPLKQRRKIRSGTRIV